MTLPKGEPDPRDAPRPDETEAVRDDAGNATAPGATGDVPPAATWGGEGGGGTYKGGPITGDGKPPRAK
jgi:hypothetical protein